MHIYISVIWWRAFKFKRKSASLANSSDHTPPPISILPHNIRAHSAHPHRTFIVVNSFECIKYQRTTLVPLSSKMDRVRGTRSVGIDNNKGYCGWVRDDLWWFTIQKDLPYWIALHYVIMHTTEISNVTTLNQKWYYYSVAVLRVVGRYSNSKGDTLNCNFACGCYCLE